MPDDIIPLRDPVEQVHYAIERPFFRNGMPSCRYALKPEECQFRQAAERAVPAFRAWQGTPYWPFDGWHPHLVVGGEVRLSAHPETLAALQRLPYRDYAGIADVILPPGLDLRIPDRSLVEFHADDRAPRGALYLGMTVDPKESSPS